MNNLELVTNPDVRQLVESSFKNQKASVLFIQDTSDEYCDCFLVVVASQGIHFLEIVGVSPRLRVNVLKFVSLEEINKESDYD